MNYLLDANTLIEAKNRYYNMKVCPGFWQWLLLRAGTNEVSSVVPVLAELKAGNDELKTWVVANEGLFVDVSDDDTQRAFGEVAEHVAALAGSMRTGALETFLGGADPWLIAKARVIGATVVTLESLNLMNRRKFLIPNICNNYGVACMDTFELLHELEAEFVLNIA